MNRGLFLDLDGTLCDSLPGLRDAFSSFLAARQRVGTEEEFEALNGATLSGIVDQLRTTHGLQESRADLEACYAAEMARARAASAPMEGARQILLLAQHHGWRTAVVTSGEREAAEEWLAKHELTAGIDFVAGAGDVAASKPSPQGYLLALERLGCRAEGSIGVEDSEAGLAALAGAGLRVFHFAPLSAAPVAARSSDAVVEQHIAKLGELVPQLERPF